MFALSKRCTIEVGSAVADEGGVCGVQMTGNRGLSPLQPQSAKSMPIIDILAGLVGNFMAEM